MFVSPRRSRGIAAIEARLQDLRLDSGPAAGAFEGLVGQARSPGRGVFGTTRSGASSRWFCLDSRASLAWGIGCAPARVPLASCGCSASTPESPPQTLVRLARRPAHHATCEQIEHHRKEGPALSRPDGGHIGDPDRVCGLHREPPTENVRRDRVRVS